MMMRGNFETSVYKPMKIAQFDRANLRETTAVIAWPRRPDKVAWIAATVLGAAGASAVFLLLRLLFA
jgi:hypothetical protein